jgi:hypothetical protein
MDISKGCKRAMATDIDCIDTLYHALAQLWDREFIPIGILNSCLLPVTGSLTNA